MALTLDELDRDRDCNEALEASLPSPPENRLHSAVWDSGQPPARTSAGGEGDDSGVDLDTDGDTPMRIDSPYLDSDDDDNRSRLSPDDADADPANASSQNSVINLDSDGRSECDAGSSLASPSVRCRGISNELTSSPSPMLYAWSASSRSC